MKRPLILVGASGLARETMEAVRAQGVYEAIGVVDDDPARWGTLLGDIKVLGGLELVSSHPDAAVVLCAGKGVTRRSLADRLGEAGLVDSRYATVLHPSVSVPDSCVVGHGSILLAGCVLTADVSIGKHVVAMPHVTFTHDDTVGDFATLCAAVTLGGSVDIGHSAYLGMASCVREHCRIGRQSLIGMGAVVLRDVLEGETWIGNPAQRIGAVHES